MVDIIRGEKRDTMKNAIAYLRGSTEEQNNGIEAQRAQVERWAAANGVELVGEYVEHVSGGASLDKRPVLNAAIDATIKGMILIVAKRDRVARDVMLSAMIERLIERKGGELVSADGAGNGSTPEAQLMRNMISAFAMYERAIIKARTKAALNVMKANGKRTGSIPFGFQLAADGVSLEQNSVEQEAISIIHQLRADGVSLRGIVAALNDGHTDKARGAQWHLTTVANIVKGAA